MAKKTTSNSEPNASEETIPSAPPVFDVSKPGKTAASPTSRPIIVTHKPMMKQDPMVKDEKTNEPEPLLPRSGKKHIKLQPSGSQTENSEPEVDKSSTETSEPDEEEPVAEPEVETPKSETGSGAVDTLAGEIGIKNEEQKAKAEFEKKQAELQKVIDSKKYNLPIHDNVYGGVGIFAFIINSLLVLMVIGAAVVLAVDAELLTINGFELPFDLIK